MKKRYEVIRRFPYNGKRYDPKARNSIILPPIAAEHLLRRRVIRAYDEPPGLSPPNAPLAGAKVVPIAAPTEAPVAGPTVIPVGGPQAEILPSADNVETIPPSMAVQTTAQIETEPSNKVEELPAQELPEGVQPPETSPRLADAHHEALSEALVANDYRLMVSALSDAGLDTSGKKSEVRKRVRAHIKG